VRYLRRNHAADAWRRLGQRPHRLRRQGVRRGNRLSDIDGGARRRRPRKKAMKDIDYWKNEGFAKVPPERSLSTVEDIGEGRRERPRKGEPCERDDSSRNCDSESCVWFAGSCCRATSGSESTAEPTRSDAPSSSAGLTAGECCRASSTPISAPERTAIPECPDCHQPMGRWGWYESDAEPVKYWYCYQCDRIRILPAGRPIVLRKEENDA